MNCPFASDAPSEGVLEQPVSQSSESVYEGGSAVRPDEDDGDSGWNTKLADHVMEEDLKKDALWGGLDGDAIKEE